MEERIKEKIRHIAEKAVAYGSKPENTHGISVQLISKDIAELLQSELSQTKGEWIKCPDRIEWWMNKFGDDSDKMEAIQFSGFEVCDFIEKYLEDLNANLNIEDYDNKEDVPDCKCGNETEYYWNGEHLCQDCVDELTKPKN